MARITRFLPAVLVGLLAGLGGETLLFLERQCWSLERALREDFRVVLFLKTELEEGRRKVLEERLLALPDAAAVAYLSRREALARLRAEDPELVESIALVGENPLRPAFEVRLAAEAFPSLPHWIETARELEDWADLRYKRGQVQAVLQAQFYGHFIHLALSAALCLLALAAFAALSTAARRARGLSWPPAPGPASRAALAAAAASAAGAALVAAAAWPMHAHAPWWSWPPAGSQALLALAAALGGWLLCPAGD